MWTNQHILVLYLLAEIHDTDFAMSILDFLATTYPQRVVGMPKTITTHEAFRRHIRNNPEFARVVGAMAAP